MEKINFVNNSVPALNATNLNKLQDNIEDSMKTEKTASDTDTYSCNYINQGNTYSTSETLTGKTWIDGKPIYRKVFTGNMTNTTNEWVNLQKCNLNNVDNIINISGTIKNTSSDRRVLPTSAYESTSYYCTFSYLGQTDYLQCYINGWTYTTFGFKYIVVIEYTKTTD